MKKKSTNKVIKGVVTAGAVLGGMSYMADANMVFATENDEIETLDQLQSASQVTSEALVEEYNDDVQEYTTESTEISEAAEAVENSVTTERTEISQADSGIVVEENSVSAEIDEKQESLSETAEANSVAEEQAVSAYQDDSVGVSQAGSTAVDEEATASDAASQVAAEAEANNSLATSEYNSTEEVLASETAQLEKDEKQLEAEKAAYAKYKEAKDIYDKQGKGEGGHVNGDNLANAMIELALTENGYTDITFSSWESGQTTRNFVRAEFKDANGETKYGWFDWDTASDGHFIVLSKTIEFTNGSDSVTYSLVKDGEGKYSELVKENGKEVDSDKLDFTSPTAIAYAKDVTTYYIGAEVVSNQTLSKLIDKDNNFIKNKYYINVTGYTVDEATGKVTANVTYYTNLIGVGGAKNTTWTVDYTSVDNGSIDLSMTANSNQYSSFVDPEGDKGNKYLKGLETFNTKQFDNKSNEIINESASISATASEIDYKHKSASQEVVKTSQQGSTNVEEQKNSAASQSAATSATLSELDNSLAANSATGSQNANSAASEYAEESAAISNAIDSASTYYESMKGSTGAQEDKLNSNSADASTSLSERTSLMFENSANNSQKLSETGSMDGSQYQSEYERISAKESAVGSAATSAEGSATTSAEGSAKTSAEGSATTSAEGSATTSAEGSATTSAEGSAKTSAEGSATTSAEGSATTSAEGSATASAEGSAASSAEGSAAASAEGSARAKTSAAASAEESARGSNARSQENSSEDEGSSVGNDGSTGGVTGTDSEPAAETAPIAGGVINRIGTANTTTPAPEADATVEVGEEELIVEIGDEQVPLAVEAPEEEPVAETVTIDENEVALDSGKEIVEKTGFWWWLPVIISAITGKLSYDSHKKKNLFAEDDESDKYY